MPSLITAHDMLTKMVDYLGGNTEQAVVRDCKAAIRLALQNLGMAHAWSYLLRRHSYTLPAAFTTGTISYNASNRQVTLTGGTWPDWATEGLLSVGTYRRSEIERRISNTVIRLSSRTAFADNLPSGTSYTLYKNKILLPDNCHKVSKVYVPGQMRDLVAVGPMFWDTVATEYGHIVPSIPQHYTLMGGPLTRMSLLITPPPLTETTVEVLMKVVPRPVRWWDERVGTVSMSIGSTTIHGFGTEFHPDMVGAVIRLGKDKVNEPTGEDGEYPPNEEFEIESVASATSMTATTAATKTHNDVRYIISDPIDVDRVVMYPALEAGCVYFLAMRRELRQKVDAVAWYEASLMEARRKDNRFMEERFAKDHKDYLRASP